jgi:hypothetical protein
MHSTVLFSQFKIIMLSGGISVVPKFAWGLKEAVEPEGGRSQNLQGMQKAQDASKHKHEQKKRDLLETRLAWHQGGLYL